MKYLHGLLLIFCSVGAAISPVSGQTEPKPVLKDEFDSINCEDLSGRLDLFFSDLNADPGAVGYLVAPPASATPTDRGWIARFVDGYPRYRGFDEGRLQIVRRKSAEGTLFQFWLIPAGAELPFERSEESEAAFPAGKTKRRIYSDLDNFGPCYTGPPIRKLAAYLKSEPASRANIVIAATTMSEYAKLKADIAASFDQVYRVSSTRLRFFRVKTMYGNVGYELWLVRGIRK